MTRQGTHFPRELFPSARTVFATLLLVAASITLAACGGSDSDGGGGNSDPANVSGTWSITENVDATDCGEGTYTDTYSITVTQSGSSITVDTTAGTFSGTVDGNTITWSGSYPEDGGTTTIDSLTATISGDSLSGNTSWSWTDGNSSCSGTTSFTGTRTSGGDTGDTNQEVEPNDSAANATVINLSGSSVSYTGNVDESTDVNDIYSFTPGSSGSFTITLDGFDPATHDLDLGIFDSSETLLDASVSADSHETITINLAGGSLYYIVVEAWTTSGTASYTVTLTRN